MSLDAHLAGRTLADNGQQTDAGTILIMIGAGLAVGLAVFLLRMRPLPSSAFKSASGRFAPWLIGLGVLTAAIGLAIHRY